MRFFVARRATRSFVKRTLLFGIGISPRSGRRSKAPGESASPGFDVFLVNEPAERATVQGWKYQSALNPESGGETATCFVGFYPISFSVPRVRGLT